jgi:hypothetical protein
MIIMHITGCIPMGGGNVVMWAAWYPHDPVLVQCARVSLG